LKDHDAGAKTADLARKHGVSEATLYNWKAKYGGMDVSEAKRLKHLEDENAKLKKLLAEQMLDAAALRELLSKKGRARRQARGVAHLRATMGLSERRACSIVSADRKMVRYRSCRPPDTELRTQLRELANERKRFGYRRLFVLLRQEGAFGHQPHLPALSRRRPHGAQATASEARRGVAGADPGRIQAERSLVGGFRP
jgi:putative transposase